MKVLLYFEILLGNYNTTNNFLQNKTVDEILTNCSRQVVVKVPAGIYMMWGSYTTTNFTKSCLMYPMSSTT